MMEILQYFVFGFIGGAVRGAVGVLKYLKAQGWHTPINWQYAFITVLAAAIIGGGVGLLVDKNLLLSVTSGYMGIDIYESLFKLVGKKG